MFAHFGSYCARITGEPRRSDPLTTEGYALPIRKRRTPLYTMLDSIYSTWKKSATLLEKRADVRRSLRSAGTILIIKLFILT